MFPTNSSNSSKFNISALDFDTIKQSLINFLSGQSEFTDFSFSGSGLQAILNLLSYNTSYLAFYLSMVSNEMFLDSASRRENVVSLAKEIGYTPVSSKSAQATINIIITPPVSPTPPAFLTLPGGTIFNSIVSGVNYFFVTTQAITVPLISGDYTFSNVSISEGIYYTYRYTVSSSNPVKYIIPNSNIDTNTLIVSIQESSESALLTTFSLSTDLTTLNSASNVYWLQEDNNYQYEAYFGDGILGTQLQDGNIVFLNYIACNADAPNGANIFTISGDIGGYSNIVITTVNAAAGGAQRETIDQIRFSAPKNYQAQNRCVTVNDYATIIEREYPNVDSVSVWGGETNIPPQYGTVFLSLKPVSGYTITNATKQSIITNILSPRNIVSIIPTIVDPDYIYLLVNSIVKYNAQNTNNSSSIIQGLVVTTIQNFAEEYVGHFNDIFRYSLLTKLIDVSEPSITNDLTTITMKKKITPVLNLLNNYTIAFSNAGVPGTLTSSTFVDSTDITYSSGQLYYLDDDGNGNIRTYKYVGAIKTYTKLNTGTINYTTGQINLNNFDPSSVTNSDGTLDVIVQPLINDIIPFQNNIIVIDDSDITVNMVVNSPLGS
jgi:hypothetical protein